MRFRRRRSTLDVDVAPPVRGAASAGDRDFSINCSLGEFGVIGIPWSGTSELDVARSFTEYLYNHDEFAELPGTHMESFRTLHVRFNGQHRLLVFRTDWITGFTVH